ncbi:unnamed protein product [Adineta steineri]|uniref:Homeobox domain-containing protein n=1 Tax=Adineta steineri TaxID=433720 RepID=A0A814P7A2_9BILA|nr:unnamed protein product [Adineta steineri]CAF1103800.1 unnamed protein product [Adineta steineri]CAF1174546.1 unnamed protein product [Adineta steineri]CAF1262225.1 unnamed protein product [Adineta steineri]CAF1398839.1 unnamed protein product [Adineta steineri]
MSTEKQRQQQSPYDYSVKRLLSQDTNSSSTERSSVLLCPPPKNRARRARTYFDDRSIQILEHAFLQEQYPDIHRREQLSNEIGTSEARVQVWFQNKRSRCRKRLLTKTISNENNIENDETNSKLNHENTFDDSQTRTPMRSISTSNVLPFTPTPIQSVLATHFPFFLQHFY